MVFISFSFASFAHAHYGWVEESAHGGIWEACFQYFGCVSVGKFFSYSSLLIRWNLGKVNLLARSKYEKE